jgi:hypothetical protein
MLGNQGRNALAQVPSLSHEGPHARTLRPGLGIRCGLSQAAGQAATGLRLALPITHIIGAAAGVLPLRQERWRVKV